MADKSDINSSFLATIVIVAGIFLLVCVVAVDAWYKNVEQEVIDQKWKDNPNTWLDGLQAQERANLDIDRRIAPRHYHVPVDVAMKILAQRSEKEQSR